MKNNDTFIYVVLVESLTGFGKFIRMFSKYSYTHVAVCLREQLDDFITFSRKKHFSPFDCGFMHEKLDCYIFGKNKSVKLKIFKVPISNKSKIEIENFIKSISNDNKYLFNFLSMLTMPILHGFKIYKTYNCMSFVSKILEISNSVKLDKKYYKYNIKEIDKILTPYFYEEGLFFKEKNETQGYMQHIGIPKNIYLFLRLNIILLYRLIFERSASFEYMSSRK